MKEYKRLQEFADRDYEGNLLGYSVSDSILDEIYQDDNSPEQDVLVEYFEKKYKCELSFIDNPNSKEGGYKIYPK